MTRRCAYDGITGLRIAALKRRGDARCLLNTGNDEHARGAAYLAGYVIECKLKAIALEINSCTTLQQLVSKWGVDDRDVYTHGLEVFAKRLPFWNRLKDSTIQKDFFNVVNAWRPSWRYDHHKWTIGEASKFLAAVDRVYRWLDVNR